MRKTMMKRGMIGCAAVGAVAVAEACHAVTGASDGTGSAVQPQMRVGKPGAARPAGWLR